MAKQKTQTGPCFSTAPPDPLESKKKLIPKLTINPSFPQIEGIDGHRIWEVEVPRSPLSADPTSGAFLGLGVLTAQPGLGSFPGSQSWSSGDTMEHGQYMASLSPTAVKGTPL